MQICTKDNEENLIKSYFTHLGGVYMSENEKVKIVREIVTAWNAHDAKKAFSFFTEDATDDDTTQPQKFSGPACANYWQEFFDAFPDVAFTVKNTVASKTMLL